MVHWLLFLLELISQNVFDVQLCGFGIVGELNGLLTFITTDSDREVSESLKMSDQEFHIDDHIEAK
jgi:hypothetical protein